MANPASWTKLKLKRAKDPLHTVLMIRWQHTLRVAIQRLVLLFALAGVGSGCQSPSQKSGGINMNDYVVRTTPLMVTRGTNGTNLAWESTFGELYTVQIRDGHFKKSQWINHPQLTNIQGTGGRIQIKDNPSASEKRKYRLTISSNPPAKHR